MLVTTIIPAHNSSRWLGEAIESVLGQTYEPIEIVVIDDGSTDSTAGVAKSFPEVRYFHQSNQGPGPARNRGIALAQGELIAFLDADDLWLPTKTAAQAARLAANPKAGCSYCGMRLLVEPGAELPEPFAAADVDRTHVGLLPTAFLARRSLFDEIGGFAEDGLHGEDLDVFMRVRDAGIEVEVVPEALVWYRIHGPSYSHGPDTRPDHWRRIRDSMARRRAALG